MWCPFALFLVVIVSHVAGVSILLLGDSLDRHMSQEWCQKLKYHMNDSAIDFNWGEGPMRSPPKGSNRIPAWICISHDTTDSLAFVHIYGSNSTGPYFHGYRNIDRVDPEVDSEIRVNRSITSYVRQFGFPNQIILHTIRWDLSRMYESIENKKSLQVNSSNWYNYLSMYENNTNERLNQINSVIARLRIHPVFSRKANAAGYTEIGLRTAVWSDTGGEILHELNRLARTIAQRRKLMLFDYHKVVWGTVDYNYSLESDIFRDHMHPKPVYSVIAAEKLLGRRFSHNLLQNSTVYMVRREEYEASLVKKYSGTHNVSLIREIGKSDIYFFDRINYSLWQNPHPDFRRIGRMTLDEVFEVNSSILCNIPLGSSIPYAFKDGTIINVTDANGNSSIYYIEDWAYRPSVGHSEDFVMRRNKSIVHLDNDSLFKQVMTQGPPLPDVGEGDVVKIHFQREIYYMKNRSLHLVPSMNKFIALGKDLDQVKSLDWKDFMFYQPLGSPLSE